MGAKAFTVTVLVVTHPATVLKDITAVPGAAPFTVAWDGDIDVIVAIEVLLLLHAPPGGVLFVNVAPCPWQTSGVPVGVIGDRGRTVTTVLVAHPDGKLYFIVTPPCATPVTSPLFMPTVAVAGTLELQVPPAIVLLNCMVCPAHTADGPVTGAVGSTVTVFVAVQPAAEVKDIIALPAPAPFTVAAEKDIAVIVAIAVLLVLQFPPGDVLFVIAIPCPWHTVEVPAGMVADIGFTAITVVTDPPLVL